MEKYSKLKIVYLDLFQFILFVTQLYKPGHNKTIYGDKGYLAPQATLRL